VRPVAVAPVAGGGLRAPRIGGVARMLGLRLAGAAVVIALWAAAATQFSAVQLPRPELVLDAIRANFWSAPGLTFEGLHGGYASNVMYTVLTALMAATAGGASGFMVGIASARSQVVRNLSSPLLVLFAAVPPLVASPFMLIWFGPGQLAQSAIVGFFCFVVMGIAAQNAASSLPPALEEMAATLGATPRQRLRRIVLPASVPAMIVAVRVCLATSWSLQTASELLGSNRGVGRIIGLSQQLGDTAASLAAIILLGLVGLTIETVIVIALRHATRWQAVERR
jgi:ABC-type nitrate/sulfonate/bicarbonate transport system permease component